MVTAASFLAAGLWMSVVALIFLVFVLFADWLERYERHQRREVLRAHRRRMDALEPKRWVS